jgi:hypothetical protein
LVSHWWCAAIQEAEELAGQSLFDDVDDDDVEEDPNVPPEEREP